MIIPLLPAVFSAWLKEVANWCMLVITSQSAEKESVFMSNRKLIRPSMKEVRESSGLPKSTPLNPSTKSMNTSLPLIQTGPSRRKQIPSEQTNSEIYYYTKQMGAKTPMVIILQDGEQIRGVIEWYDRSALKVNRHREPNLLILKHNIKYMYKQEEENRSHRRRKRTFPSDD